MFMENRVFSFYLIFTVAALRKARRDRGKIVTDRIACHLTLQNLGVMSPWQRTRIEIRGHVRIVPDKLFVKFDVCSFNRFAAIGI